MRQGCSKLYRSHLTRLKNAFETSAAGFSMLMLVNACTITRKVEELTRDCICSNLGIERLVQKIYVIGR